MESVDRRIANRRIWPAINLIESGTRKETLLAPDVLQRMWTEKIFGRYDPYRGHGVWNIVCVKRRTIQNS